MANPDTATSSSSLHLSIQDVQSHTDLTSESNKLASQIKKGIGDLCKYPMRKSCSRNCKNKDCYMITDEDRAVIWEEFWKLTYTDRRLWLLYNIKFYDVKLRKVIPSSKFVDIDYEISLNETDFSCVGNKQFKKHETRDYFLPKPSGDYKPVKVCQKLFLSTLGYTNDSVITELSNAIKRSEIEEPASLNREKAFFVSKIDCEIIKMYDETFYPSYDILQDGPLTPNSCNTVVDSSLHMLPMQDMQSYTDIIQASNPKGNKRLESQTEKEIRDRNSHPIRENCPRTCKNKYCSMITNEDRTIIWEEFWKLHNDDRKLWLCRHIKFYGVKRLRVTSSPKIANAESAIDSIETDSSVNNNEHFRKNEQRDYFLPKPSDDYKKVKVCQKLFLSTLGYTTDSIITKLWSAIRKNGFRESVGGSQGKALTTSKLDCEIIKMYYGDPLDMQAYAEINDSEPKKKKKLTNQTEKEIRDRKKHPMRESCAKNCKSKNCSTITDDDRTILWDEFWKLPYADRRQWLSRHVKFCSIKRRTVTPFPKVTKRGRRKGSIESDYSINNNKHFKKNETREYFLPKPSDGYTQVKVCQKLFLNTLGYTNDSVITELSSAIKRSESGEAVGENRGRNSPRTKIDRNIIKVHNETMNLPLSILPDKPLASNSSDATSSSSLHESSVQDEQPYSEKFYPEVILTEES